MTYQVVVGVDGSAHGEAALRFALAEAEAHEGEVTAVFAWQVPFLSIPGAFDREELEKASMAYLIEKGRAVAPSPKVPLRTLVAEGEAAEALITAARDADMLAVGTRGRSAFRGMLVGAVSLRCVVGAPCPVVLVKTPDDAAQLALGEGAG
jgi:nucleotide-binding universal stress UspA family protein